MFPSCPIKMMIQASKICGLSQYCKRILMMVEKFTLYIILIINDMNLLVNIYLYQFIFIFKLSKSALISSLMDVYGNNSLINPIAISQVKKTSQILNDQKVVHCL